MNKVNICTLGILEDDSIINVKNGNENQAYGNKRNNIQTYSINFTNVETTIRFAFHNAGYKKTVEISSEVFFRQF